MHNQTQIRSLCVADFIMSPGFEAKRVDLVCGDHMIIQITSVDSAKAPHMVYVDQELWDEIPETQ